MRKLKLLTITCLLSLSVLTSCGDKDKDLDDYKDKKKTESVSEDDDDKKKEKEKDDTENEVTSTPKPTQEPDDEKKDVIQPSSTDPDISEIKNTYKEGYTAKDVECLNCDDIVSKEIITDVLIDNTECTRDYEYVYNDFDNVVGSLDGFYDAFFNIDPSMDEDTYYDNLNYWMTLTSADSQNYSKWFNVMHDSNATCKYLGFRPYHVLCTEDEYFGYLQVDSLIYVEIESDFIEKGVYEIDFATGTQHTEPFDSQYTAFIDDSLYHNGLNKTMDKHFIITDGILLRIYNKEGFNYYIDLEKNAMVKNKDEALLEFSDYYKEYIKEKKKKEKAE